MQPARGAHDVSHKTRRGAKGVSLKRALLAAAERKLAPPLYVDAHDVSLSALKYGFDWGKEDDQQQEHNANQEERYNIGPLQSLLAERIDALAVCSPAEEDKSSRKRDAAATQLLRRHGYDEEDLAKWISLLTISNSFRAATLLAETRSDSPSSRKYIPPFVLLSFLRRHQLSPRALRAVVDYTMEWLENQNFDEHELSSWPQEIPDIDQTAVGEVAGNVSPNYDHKETIVLRVFLRLFRHARETWPPLLEVLAEALTTLLRLPAKRAQEVSEGRLPARHLARLSMLYNRILYLLSLPTAASPFKSVVYQEAAQARILGFMATHDPPLVINREGYRGVIRVQLARKKTAEEEEWAQLKSPSWPPWKEERTGMDAYIGVERGISRAGEVLARMQEAGYPLEEWEYVAQIYAGWDTDRSPTIQTRTIAPAPFSQNVKAQIWAARIDSTRTVYEAWACFLACEEESIKLRQEVYFAMFQKLTSESKRRQQALKEGDGGRRRARVRQIYAGDAKEVFPPPASSHQATYTRSEPPSVEQLFHHMLSNKTQPSGRTQALLVSNAPTLRLGLRYLRSGPDLTKRGVDGLLYLHPDHDTTRVPDTVFAAFIKLLCRFAGSKAHNILGHPLSRPRTFVFADMRLNLYHSLAHALYLLTTTDRYHRPAWNSLLQSLVHKTGTSVSAAWVHDLGLEHGSALRNDFDKILSFDITRAVVSHMQNIDLTLDEDGFRYLCYGLENAIRASHSILARFGTTNREMSYKLRDSRFDHLSKPDVQLCISAHHTLRKKNYVQVKFWQLVGGEETDASANTSYMNATKRNGRFPSLPRLYVTPGPAVLHAYIRALGCLQDFEGLRKLVMWMAQYRGELSERKAEDRNGEDMMRRALIALKLALEGRLVDVARGEEDASETPENEKEEVAVDDKDAATASEETLREILGLVESVEEWGGWPDEEETQAYVDAA